jgi:transcriptional regulator with XRE-family HTH domain
MGARNGFRQMARLTPGHLLFGGAMRREQRVVAARELDVKQKHFRLGGKANKHHGPWLRGVRQALGITAVEMAETLRVGRETVFRMERRERAMDISMVKLDQMAHAMGCQLVYSIVPVKGTLTEMGEAQAWKKRLKREEKARAKGMGVARVVTEPEATKPAAKRAGAARRETPEEKEERLELVRKLREMAAHVKKTTEAAATTGEPEDETGNESGTEKEYRQMLANLEKQGVRANENLKRQILRKIEEARRERVGGPLLETEAEEKARLREQFEANKRWRERGRPVLREVSNLDLTLEEMENQVKVWDETIEIEKKGGRADNVEEYEGYRRGFVESIAERKMVEEEKNAGLLIGG